MWYVNNLAGIIYACIILHNMIIDDEGSGTTNWFDDDTSEAQPQAVPHVGMSWQH